MPFIIPTEQRIKHLIATYNEGGFEAAMITENTGHYYITELEEIGPTYIMDDFGDAVCITFEMFWQRAYIFPPLNVLT